MTDGAEPKSLAELLAVMAALRHPQDGCAWDRQQTFPTIAPYTIEEAYEVADAIDRGDLADLEDELGDLLLQVVYHARLAEERGAFAFADVVDGITRKMIRRHPHVFGDAAGRTTEAAEGLWEAQKAAERAAKAAQGGSGTEPGTLDGVTLGLPALTRAIKLQNKAARVGFDWPSLAPVLAKVKEELAELEEAIAALDGPEGQASSGQAPGQTLSNSAQPPAGVVKNQASALPAPEHLPSASAQPPAGADKVKEEFGDLLFVMANVARHLQLDPEGALRSANQKFVRRFARVEALLAERGKTPSQSDLIEMDALWDQAKAEERPE